MSKKYFYIAVAVVLIGGTVATMTWVIPKQEKPNDGGAIGEFWGTIIGTVSLGPTCPVERIPPDPQCADKPYKTNLVLTTADQSRVITSFSSDADGKFSIEIQPGEYAIRSAAAANILPYCASNGTIKVNANSYTETAVSCDTGIR